MTMGRSGGPWRQQDTDDDPELAAAIAASLLESQSEASRSRGTSTSRMTYGSSAPTAPSAPFSGLASAAYIAKTNSHGTPAAFARP